MTDISIPQFQDFLEGDLKSYAWTVKNKDIYIEKVNDKYLLMVFSDRKQLLNVSGTFDEVCNELTTVL